MVDFQSRDTRRGPVADDDDDDDEAETEAEPSDEGADSEEPTDEGTGPEAGTAAGEGDDGEEAEPSQPDADPLAESEPAPSDDETEAERVAGEAAPATTDSEAERRSDESSQTAGGDPLAESKSKSKAGPAPTTGDATDPEPAPARTDDEAAARQPVEPVRTVDVAVVTVGEGSETAVVEGFEAAGHTIATRERLQGDYDGLQRSVDTLVSRGDVDVVVTTGGIGISPDAVTIEAVHPLFEKALPGFGEAFRTLLYDVIGTGIVAVRSAAGVADGTLVFCLPADAEAAGLAVGEILVTEAPELVAHLDE